jgi:ubiquinone/menaquinone biosynthesis C-methylase UbiE
MASRAVACAHQRGEVTVVGTTYILSHSQQELRRLRLQADILKPITTRLLREAGLAQGMRVVDLGCGPGDVSLLAAEIVGPTGLVTGIDRSPSAIDTARMRVKAAGLANINFVEADAAVATGTGTFDLAVGRYVLLHQSDPAAFVRAATTHVRRGGAVAFHEVVAVGGLWSFPTVPLWQQVTDLLVEAFRSAQQHPEAGAHMIKHFHDAGLPQPSLFSEIPVSGGPHSPLYAWVAETLRMVLPHVERVGPADPGETDIDSLEDRLRQAVTAVRGQVCFGYQYCGWTRI